MPCIGTLAPLFEKANVLYPDGSISELSLSQYKGKWIVLLFYPLDFTFVCPTEILAFSEMVQEFKSNQCEVIAISKDSVYTHLAWSKTSRKEGGIEGFQIPLVSDINKSISTAYGALNMDESYPLRSTFILDHTLTLRHWSTSDTAVGRSAKEVLRLIQAFQNVESTGQVCPEGWIKGDKMISPNPSDSKEYFKNSMEME